MTNLKRLLPSIICYAFSGYLFFSHVLVYASEVSFSRLNSAEYIVQIKNNERDAKVTFNLNQSFDKSWKLYLLGDISCENFKEDRLYKIYILTFLGGSKIPEHFHFNNADGFNTWIIDKKALSNIDAATIAGGKNISRYNFCFYMGYKYAYWMEIGKIITLVGLCIFSLGAIIFYRRKI